MMESFKYIKYDFVDLLDHYERLKLAKNNRSPLIDRKERKLAGARISLLCHKITFVYGNNSNTQETRVFSGIVARTSTDDEVVMATSCGKTVKFNSGSSGDGTISVFPYEENVRWMNGVARWIMCPDQEMAKISIEAQKQTLACTDFAQYLTITPTEYATLDLKWFSDRYLGNCTTYQNRAHAHASIMSQFGGGHSNECCIKVTFIGVSYDFDKFPNVGPYGTPIKYETQNP